jgi:hypothetical protein
MRDLEPFVRDSQELLNNGASVEEVLARLRENGCEVIESIKVLTEAAGMDLDTAKRTVHFSETWSDRLGDHEAFHDRAEEAARQEATEEDAGDNGP